MSLYNRRKFSTTVYLDKHQVDALAKLSSITKVPTAEYVRQGIDLVITKETGYPPPRPSIVKNDTPEYCCKCGAYVESFARNAANLCVDCVIPACRGCGGHHGGAISCQDFNRAKLPRRPRSPRRPRQYSTLSTPTLPQGHQKRKQSFIEMLADKRRGDA